jgi:hypothetical protein
MMPTIKPEMLFAVALEPSPQLHFLISFYFHMFDYLNINHIEKAAYMDENRTNKLLYLFLIDSSAEIASTR